MNEKMCLLVNIFGYPPGKNCEAGVDELFADTKVTDDCTVGLDSEWLYTI